MQTGAEIHFLVKPAFAGILQHNPYIRKIHHFKDISTARKLIREEKFDLIIDLQKNFKSRLTTIFQHCNTVTFNKLNVEKWIYVQFKLNLLPSVHLVDRYFEALKPDGIYNDGKGLDFFTNPQIPAPAIPLNASDDYNVLVLGANYFTKRIPLSKCNEIIQSSPHPVVLLGGSDVVRESRQLWQANSAKTIDMSGKISLDESALLLKGAIRVFTGDTGLMHIAAALQKNIVVLWGNTTPALGMFPYFGQYGTGTYLSIENIGLSCRPCSKLGHASCPKSHFKCMNDLDLNFLKNQDEQ